MVALQGNKAEIFDRGAIADLLDLDSAVVKNWSTGKPLKIEASVYSPGRRGTQSLYSRTDVYLFALAKVWSQLGFSFDAISRVLDRVKKEPEWLAEETRGGLVLARLRTDDPIIKHLPRTLSPNESQIEHARIIMPLMYGKDFYGAYFSPIGAICDWVDKQIKGTQGHEKKSR